MIIGKKIFQRSFIGLYAGVLLILIYGYTQGYDLSIPWNVTTNAEATDVIVHQFQKGPFTFYLSGTIYSLAERYSAGPIQHNGYANTLFLILIFLGVCIVLSISTYLSRTWFIGIAGLFIFFIINLRLQDIGIFGLDEGSQLAVIILLASYLLPTYLFHAFYTVTHYLIRLGALLLISMLIVLFGQINPDLLQAQLISNGYYPFVILSLAFLFLIAEDNILGILYLITRSKGSSNNHLHFSVFSLLYLVFLGAYYGKKSGMLDIELIYFDAFLLFITSSAVALWGTSHKQNFLKSVISIPYYRILFIGLGIITFSFISLSLWEGNDPVYEGFHYFIIYTHLAFGTMFTLYVLINFINPLAKGIQVYKIVYREQNFPYISAKLGGIAAVLAFFFLANKEPFFLFRAGHFNYMGIQAELTDEKALAQEYYREGSIYGQDNHFSNYKIAFNQFQNEQIERASYTFGRATLRYPSPHAFVNHSNILTLQDKVTPALVSLQNGLRIFPKNPQIQNNLGLAYLNLDKKEDAIRLLSKANNSQGSPNVVNGWSIRPTEDSIEVTLAYQDGNIATQTNILFRHLLEAKYPSNLTFDSTKLDHSDPLHRLTFLTNACWYFANDDLSPVIEKALASPTDEQAATAAKEAASISSYLRGDVNKALKSHQILKIEAPGLYQGKYPYEMGLMALEQHALSNAFNFFEEAISHGHQKSLIAKAATLMELKDFQGAIKWGESLSDLDPRFEPIAADIKKIVEDDPATTEERLAKLYYFYPEYTLEEIAALVSIADPQYHHSFWKKVSRELLTDKNYDLLQSYLQLFKPYLHNETLMEAELLIALSENQIPADNQHLLSKALRLKEDSSKSKALIQLANQNALNTPLLLAVTNQLNQLDEEAVYDALINAYNLDPHSPEIIMAYVDQCLQMNLADYATVPLDRLAELLPNEQYFTYFESVNKRLEELEKEESW